MNNAGNLNNRNSAVFYLRHLKMEIVAITV